MGLRVPLKNPLAKRKRGKKPNPLGKKKNLTKKKKEKSPYALKVFCGGVTLAFLQERKTIKGYGGKWRPPIFV